MHGEYFVFAIGANSKKSKVCPNIESITAGFLSMQRLAAINSA